MKIVRTSILASLLPVLLSTVPVHAQVLSATADVKGITCALCLPPLEQAARSQPGVGDVKISMSRQTVDMSYAKDAPLNFSALDQTLAGLNANVQRLRIVARGQVAGSAAKREFVAGKNRFLLTAASPALPQGKPLIVTGLLEQGSGPMQLTVTQFAVGAHAALPDQADSLKATTP
ncbi:MAG TPA: hypothetical protein VKV28_05890 [Candidatus Binataceae bacterium]|nr:hypothetical protein [Candidatus Binataceae bacterium]